MKQAKSSPRRPRQIASDQQPFNPLLGNVGPQRGRQLPSSSGMGTPAADEHDFFRTQDSNRNGAYREEPLSSMTAARVWQGVRLRWNPIKGLDFKRLTSYWDNWRAGNFDLAGKMMEAMYRRDYQIRICAPKREKAVARHGYDILTINNLEGEEARQADEQQRFLSHFYQHLTTTTAMNPDEQGGLTLLIRQMMQAQSFYYSVHETVWKPDDDGTLTAQMIHCPVWWFEGTRGKLRYKLSEFGYYGEPMLARDWMISCGDGLMEAISHLFLIKWMPIQAWVGYLDKFGMPGLLGKTHAKMGSPEWTAMADAIKNFSRDYAAVIGGCAGDLKDNDLTLVEAKGSYGGQFSDLVDKVDRAITQLYRGGDLGTSSGKDQAGASLQGDESGILEEDDSAWIEETLKRQLSRDALQWKFGPKCKELVYLKLRTLPKDEHASTVSSVQTITQLGGEVGKAWLHETLGVPVPKPGEETLSMPSPMGGMPPQGEPMPEDVEYQDEPEPRENVVVPTADEEIGSTEPGPFDHLHDEEEMAFPNTAEASNDAEFERKHLRGHAGKWAKQLAGGEIEEDWEDPAKLKGKVRLQFIPESETKEGRAQDKLRPKQIEHEFKSGETEPRVMLGDWKLASGKIVKPFESPADPDRDLIHVENKETGTKVVYDRDTHTVYSLNPNLQYEPDMWRKRRRGEWAGPRGGELPEHISVPGDWDGDRPVYANFDPDAEHVLYGVSGTGKVMHVLSASHNARRDEGKNSKCQTLMDEWPDVYQRNESALNSKQKDTQEAAEAVKLIMHTGLRSGVSDSDNFGCVTLQGRHILKEGGGQVRLKFIGKKGSDVDLVIEDKALKEILLRRKANAGDSKPLFPILEADRSRIGQHSAMLGKEESYKTKDFRMGFATREAQNYMQAHGLLDKNKPRTPKEIAQALGDVCRHVARKLGHSDTGGTAFKSYIQPFIWRGMVSEDEMEKPKFHRKGDAPKPFKAGPAPKRSEPKRVAVRAKASTPAPRPTRVEKPAEPSAPSADEVRWPSTDYDKHVWREMIHGGTAGEIAQRVADRFKGETEHPQGWDRRSTFLKSAATYAQDMEKAGVKHGYVA